MTQPVRLAIAGAGLIGRRHAAAISAVPGVVLQAIVDPSDAGRAFAREIGAPWYASLGHMLEHGDPAVRPDCVIVATPNRLHVENGLACVAAGIPALIEKPLASDLETAETLVAAGERAGVPLAVGHHRRHNPLIEAARQRLAAGDLGTIVAVHGMFWVMKPQDYFDTAWRREPGAGPLMINLIHDIDLLRHLVGEIVWVRALASNAVRGGAVEDTAAMLLRFESGALGSFSLSDTVVAPWSWELTAAENPAYPPTGQSCYFIGGTKASLQLPDGRVWSHPGAASWEAPLSTTTHPVGREDPLVRQIAQFARVVRGVEAPLVSAREGLATLRVIDALRRSAATDQAVTL
ncbi:Gfo/Idh/MocA family protein [Hoeflea olei]|uniref:Oxidoreductase n=1 Tax=Hoeflea olei TaxID=1480615 RepID=A0A1C1YQX8_9HYPH|nr:Gfo/Idh/MocA family oxidoreductase [Hoeflea olei]OCW55971.1 oxidoreductase [Hoeflea olei]